MSAAIGKKVGNTSVGSPAASPRRKSQQLGINAKKVVSKRYSLKDLKGRPLEEWGDIVRRVVGHVSMAETGEKRDKFCAGSAGFARGNHGTRQGSRDYPPDRRRHGDDL